MFMLHLNVLQISFASFKCCLLPNVNGLLIFSAQTGSFYCHLVIFSKVLSIAWSVRGSARSCRRRWGRAPPSLISWRRCPLPRVLAFRRRSGRRPVDWLVLSSSLVTGRYRCSFLCLTSDLSSVRDTIGSGVTWHEKSSGGGLVGWGGDFSFPLVTL